MPSAWSVSDDGGVYDEINRCPDIVRADFLEVFEQLVVDPRSTRLGVLSYEDPEWPGEGLTVPFDDALLFYSLTPDIPTIRLQYVIWRTDRPY